MRAGKYVRLGRGPARAARQRSAGRSRLPHGRAVFLSGRPADVLGVAKSLNVFRPRRYASPSAAKAEQRRKGPGETGRPPTRSAPPKLLWASPLVGGIGKR